MRGLGVASAADFVAQVRNMQVQPTAMGAAMAELQGALTRSQAMGQEAYERATRAEGERSDLVKALAGLAGRGGGDGLVDSQGVGQPFKFHGRRDARGKSDQDFSEWTLKLALS